MKRVKPDDSADGIYFPTTKKIIQSRTKKILFEALIEENIFSEKNFLVKRKY